MSFWPTFWTVVFASAIGFFAVLSLVVTVGGAMDIRQMLRALRAEADALKEKANPGESEP